MRFSRLLGISAVLGVAPGIVLAMSQSSIPSKFGVPWGNSAGPSYIRAIPTTSQIGIQNCAASLPDGFPPLTFTPQAQGGCPPFGQDFNGILKQITQWSQWQSAGGPVFWDSAFSTSIGGYPKGAILQSAVLSGRLWFSTADNNTTNPDSQTSANWIPLPGTAPAGTPIPSFSTTPPPNAVPASGQSVGNPSSNASLRANADAYWLFVALWTNCGSCSLFNSGGGAVNRGANANADWNANIAITTPLMSGAGLIGIDNVNGGTSTNLVGVPVTSGNRTTPMSVLGENLHTLTLTETANGIVSSSIQTITVGGTVTVSGNVTGPQGHTMVVDSTLANAATTGGTFGLFWTGGSSVNNASFVGSMTGANSLSQLNTLVVTANNTGGGAHNTVERSFLVQWNLAL